ncbi:MAG: DUF92 domain-containing protein [Thermoproteota archaeon]
MTVLIPAEAIAKTLTIIALSIAIHVSRSLTVSGVLASMVIGVITLFLGGWGCFIIMLMFLILGVAFTKYRHREKAPGTLAQEKGGVRTWVNVFANGVPAAIPIVLEAFYGMEAFPVFFLAAVCSATGDTLSTEIGLLSRSKPRLITDLRRKVEKGLSGGVTPLGTAAGLIGSISISLVALATCLAGVPSVLLKVNDFYRLALAGSVGGFIGMLIDSLLGATVQGIYVSKADGMLYEDPRKCGGGYVLIKGFKHFGNNAVNFISCLLAGLLSIAFYYFP